MLTEVFEVLVLCQRKPRRKIQQILHSDSDYDPDSDSYYESESESESDDQLDAELNNISKNIDKFVRNEIISVNISYLTPGLSNSNDESLKGRSDYPFSLKRTSKNPKCIQFIESHKEFYSLIILNTCPFAFMNFSLIYELLKPNGIMAFRAFQDNAENFKRANLHWKTFFEGSEFRTHKRSRLEMFFKPIGNNLFRKRDTPLRKGGNADRSKTVKKRRLNVSKKRNAYTRQYHNRYK